LSTSDSKAQADLPLPVFASSERVLSLLSISPDALLLVDQVGVLVMLNEQAEALFGYAHGELANKRLDVLLPARFHPAHTAHLKQYFSAPRTRPMNTGLSLISKRKDGTEFPVDISLMPLLLGETRCAICAVRDMTTAQQAIETQLAAYREIEQHLSILNLMLSLTGSSVSVFDTQGRYRFASENTARHLGLAQRDFVGKTWQELGLPAEFMAPVVAQLQKVLSTGQSVVEEILFSVTSGMRWFECVAQPLVDAEGAVESVIVSSRDITERQQAAATQRRLISLVESSGEAILSITLEGVITSWNSSAEKLFGYRAEEVVDQSVLLLFPPDLHQQWWSLLAHVRTGESVKDVETVQIRKNGTPVEVSFTVSPIADHQGRIIGASAIAHEITEHKRLIRDLLDANAALEEANQARGQFLATMSHELRTPLASIIGFSEMLLGDATEIERDPAQHDNLRRILKNGHYLLEMVNDVLDLEKIEARRMKLSMTSVDVQQLLATVVEGTQSIAAMQHLVLRVEVEERIGCLETDAMRLRQVLLNLVTNALKFTKQGEVIISARRVAPSDQQAESVAIAVKDSGIGIPLDKQGQIFEAFYQVDGSYTRRFGGTGLGLSIVSQFTRLLGGQVEIDSAPGQGSTFTVTLPLKAAHPSIEQDIPRLHAARKEEISTSRPSSDDGTRTTPRERWLDVVQQAASKGQSNVVLVVDDNPDVIAFIKIALQTTPLTVVGVQDPTQVLEQVQTLHPCAITLDVMMPGINGWQLLHQLKDNPTTASIPVVMISVLSEQTTGYVLGADAYLLKPFKIAELLSTLQHLMKPQPGASPTHLPETPPGATAPL
jgi:PAS domain S-box-containing protein